MSTGAPDTIVAVATPPGRGGVGIVRVSGARATDVCTALLGDVPPARRAVLRAFRDAQGRAIDRGLALYFPAPNSYTGEDVLELHGHGGPVVMDLLVQRVLECGARLARPGEFSERAYLNDRLDLAQAEAVADLIDATSAAAARAALRSLDGEFSSRVNALADRLVELRTYVEAAIDFPDEEIDFLADGAIRARVADALAGCEAIAASAEQGRLLREGYVIVIAGRPNAGKSSLLNALAGHDAAIVTDVPGTTRDVLRERIAIDGLPLTVLDTAGLREVADVVEAEGIRRARREIERADRVLYVVDASDADAVAAAAREAEALPGGVPVTLVYSKCDLPGAEGAATDATDATDAAAEAVRVSTRTAHGLDDLRAHLKAAAGFVPGEGGEFSARRRHLDALARARGHLGAALERLETSAGAELAAEELRLAHAALGEITGEVTSDDLLGRIFASFCIGK
ncbi:MAG: tRNA uridine-5-carboxymethylaminomethyl(34) synthesis GTPase MnmE [Steroidobacteraceae bacterium]|jgi:tRNA modification GTPase|nr:tRNA uridine-5-carboxymethylaminomethyl(34) synthesis GTPase MnmE [Steroidobacteraceae bacterium]